MDVVAMPHLDGIEATRFVAGRPAGTRVVMSTMSEEDETVLSAIGPGPRATCSRGRGRGGAQRGHTAAAGRMVFGAALAGRVAAYFASARPPAPVRRSRSLDLTDRERHMLDMLAGKSNDAIAGELYLSNKTVRNAVSTIYVRLHTAGRASWLARKSPAGSTWWRTSRRRA